MEHEDRYLIVGDIGGTNIRLQLLKMNMEDLSKPELVFTYKFHSHDYFSFSNALIDFILKS